MDRLRRRPFADGHDNFGRTRLHTDPAEIRRRVAAAIATFLAAFLRRDQR